MFVNNHEFHFLFTSIYIALQENQNSLSIMSSVFASVYAFTSSKNKKVQNEIFKENKINEKTDKFHDTFTLTFELNTKLANHEDVFADMKSTV